jgi:2'-5' RNA ligase
MPRIFIAIPIPDTIKEQLFKVRSGNPDSFRWVSKENLHVTLVFLGEITLAQENLVAQTVKEACHLQGPLSLRVESLGAFPSLKRPQVLWAGLSGQTHQLGRMQSRVVQALINKGFRVDDRPFVPHITLARSKGNSVWPNELNGKREQVFGSWTANKVEVKESQLRPSGPIYRVRHQFWLDNNES